MTSEPLILLTNDDGYFAEGIRSLRLGLKGLGRLFVIAPDREKSASSLALSLRRPLRVRKIKPNVFSIDGTPVDCIYFALKKILPRTPDLMISGMNPGPNLGQQDVVYSGTVSAAVQGTFFQVPSVAVSLIPSPGGCFCYRESARIVRGIAAYLLEHRLPDGVTLNVNIPPPPIRGLKITRVGIKRYEPEIIEKKDPRENSYFWIGRGNPTVIGGKDTDVRATREGYVSVSPLRIDLTDCGALRAPILRGMGSVLKDE